MRNASQTIYRICTYLYLALAIAFAVLGTLYCSVFLINKTPQEASEKIGKGVMLIIASSITCVESIIANRAHKGTATHVAALVWGIIGVVGAYSVGTLLTLGGIFGLVADNHEKQLASRKVVDEPKDEEKQE